MAPEIDVRAIRRAAGMTQDEFAAAYQFSVRTSSNGSAGSASGPARTLLRAIKADPGGLQRSADGSLERPDLQRLSESARAAKSRWGRARRAASVSPR